MRGIGMIGARAVAMAAASLGVGDLLSTIEIRDSRPDVMPSKKRQRTSARYVAPRTTTYHSPNGTRECARRLRQIEAGRLRSSNGLASEEPWAEAVPS